VEAGARKEKTDEKVSVNCMQRIIQRIRQIKSGTVIPKPSARKDFVVKGWGERGGEEALVYLIPNHRNQSKPSQKGITASEWQSAYNRLVEEGELTKTWFQSYLPRCAAEEGCNFTTIGGIFSLLGLATYDRPGVYRMT
jgi:hypothetical protein